MNFGWCRAYLVAMPLLSVVIPLLEIPLWPAKVAALPPIETLPIEAASTPDTTASAFSIGHVVGILYALGVLLLLGLLLYQWRSIRRLKHGATITREQGMRIVRTPHSIASFSFFRTVYLPAATPDQEATIILKHEASHIRHFHSAERLALELEKALLWWNPFVWMAARRLTEVHEFEADQDVLKEGEETSRYIETIFKQLFGYSPDIANGLRDSLTKKRFKMMTQKTPSRHVRLRLAAMLSLIVALTVAVGSGSYATQYTKSEKLASQQPKQNPIYLVDGRVVEEIGSIAADEIESMTVIKSDTEALRKALEGTSITLEEALQRGAVLITMKTPQADKKEEKEVSLQQVKEVNQIVFELVEYEDGNTEMKELKGKINKISKVPSFQGGTLSDFQRWVLNQIRYPKKAKAEERNVRVVAQFCIDTDGTLNEITILQTGGEEFSNEVIRVLKQSPQWEPGTENGQAVKVRYALPIDFVSQGKK